MFALFSRLTGIGSDTTSLEYWLLAGAFASAFVAAGMIAVTRFATLQAASHAAVAHFL
jgi:hypothetical protein